MPAVDLSSAAKINVRGGIKFVSYGFACPFVLMLQKPLKNHVIHCACNI